MGVCQTLLAGYITTPVYKGSWVETLRPVTRPGQKSSIKKNLDWKGKTTNNVCCSLVFDGIARARLCSKASKLLDQINNLNI
eukprot:872759-Pelagomonas_calceolata.AAC.1